MSEDLERGLRAALRREDPPAGFAERILAKAGLDETKLSVVPKRQATWLRRPFTLALAAAVAAVAIIPMVAVDYQRREQARGLKAKQDLLTALTITRNQLQHAREKVRNTTRTIHEN